jgi:hypothetical protein
MHAHHGAGERYARAVEQGGVDKPRAHHPALQSNFVQIEFVKKQY